MLARESAIRQYGDEMCGLRDALIRSMHQVHPVFSQWHLSRQWEYPFAIETCPPVGDILDIGSDPKFYGALIGLGHRVVSHHIYIDAMTRGRIHPWEEGGRGGLGMEKFYRLNRHAAPGVFGLLEDLTFVKEEFFDTIYCISVVEHASEEELPGLIDGLVRFLKPGGRLCLTADWLPEFPVGGGFDGKMRNYDMTVLLDRLKLVTPANEIPWMPGFVPEKFNDPDVLKLLWEGHQLIVYGMTFKKE